MSQRDTRAGGGGHASSVSVRAAFYHASVLWLTDSRNDSPPSGRRSGRGRRAKEEDVRSQESEWVPQPHFDESPTADPSCCNLLKLCKDKPCKYVRVFAGQCQRRAHWDSSGPQRRSWGEGRISPSLKEGRWHCKEDSFSDSASLGPPFHITQAGSP